MEWNESRAGGVRRILSERRVMQGSINTNPSRASLGCRGLEHLFLRVGTQLSVFLFYPTGTKMDQELSGSLTVYQKQLLWRMHWQIKGIFCLVLYLPCAAFLHYNDSKSVCLIDNFFSGDSSQCHSHSWSAVTSLSALSKCWEFSGFLSVNTGTDCNTWSVQYFCAE